MIRVTHIISDLIVGGAQVMLHDLLKHTNEKAGFEVEVISLTDMGVIGAQIETLGIPVRAIGMRPRDAMNLRGVRKLTRELRRFRPDVVQTWLYHADFIGGLAARFVGVRHVAWGLHASHLDSQSVKRTTLWTVRACAKLSHRVPSKIVCCAEAARRIHAEAGYDAEKMIVIPNGFDTERFKPDAVARAAVRAELNIADDVPLVGLCGRFHPQKNHENFVRAAAHLNARMPEARFLLCGEGSDWQNSRLAGWIDEAGLRDCFHLVGRRADMPRLYAALDILSLSSSYGEAFPMVVGEAMACGVPCVVTDIGDSSLLIGDTGRVVSAEDSHALAEAWSEVLGMTDEQREVLGRAARRRIESHYGIAAIAARYASLYRMMARS